MKERLIKNMGYLIVLVDICIYFILSYVFVDNFQLNILSILVNGVLLFVGAVIATTAMMKQGILVGRDTERYKETLTAHLTQKKKIYPKLNNLQDWLDYNYIELLRIGRSVYVNSAGFNYNEIFNEDGKLNNSFKLEKPETKEYIKWYQKIFLPFFKFCSWVFSDDWRIYREKKYFIKKAKRYKITRLTVSDLMNINASSDPNNFGITESQYQKRQSGFTIVSRLLFSVMLQSVSFGFYGFNMTTFLVQMLIVVMIVLSGLFSMFNAYSFMVKTHRETIIKKINKMEEFDNVDKSIINRLEKDKEEQCNGTHTEIPLRTTCSVVEEIHECNKTGEANNLCGNQQSGV